jgi:hypothetical protein
MTAPERLWACDPDGENEIAVWVIPDEGGTEYIRHDASPATVAEMPGAKALVAAMIEAAAAEADSEGWPGSMSAEEYDALTTSDEGAMDCGTRIADAIRALAPDALAHLARRDAEMRRQGMLEAACMMRGCGYDVPDNVSFDEGQMFRAGAETATDAMVAALRTLAQGEQT